MSYDILDAAAEYLQEERTSKAILQSFKRIDPNIPYHLPTLQIIEQYDPDDLSDEALSQPHAWVAAKVITLADNSQFRTDYMLSLNLEDVMNKGPNLAPVGVDALARLRNFLAPEEKIGWWVVYNGDPERAYPESDEESEDENNGMETETEPSEGGRSSGKERQPVGPNSLSPKPILCQTFVLGAVIDLSPLQPQVPAKPMIFRENLTPVR